MLPITNFKYKIPDNSDENDGKIDQNTVKREVCIWYMGAIQNGESI